MHGLLQDRTAPAHAASVVLHLCRTVEQLLALIALVPPSVLVRAMGTDSPNKPVCQEQVAFFAIALGHLLLFDPLLLVDVQKDLLADFTVPLSRSPAEVVKTDVEPFVHLGVDLVVIVANLTGSFLLFESFNLGGSSVLVSPTDVEHVGPL